MDDFAHDGRRFLRHGGRLQVVLMTLIGTHSLGMACKGRRFAGLKILVGFHAGGTAPGDTGVDGRYVHFAPVARITRREQARNR